MYFTCVFTSLLLCICCRLVLSQQLRGVTADQIPLEQQTYDFHQKSRCRILAHESVFLSNSEHQLLIIDGGFGLFQTQLGDEVVSVTDLNPFTVAFDLSKNFVTTTVEPTWNFKKPYNSSMDQTIVNHGGLWSSMSQDCIWMQGGHFYHGEQWLNSSYYMPKERIPQWEIWEMNVTDYKAGWRDITGNVSGSEDADRTFAGAAVSVANSTMKFWVGGLLDSTTSPTTPNDTIQTTRQMLAFNEDTQTISNQDYYQINSTEGYWQGNLIHLPIGEGSGYLISLMSLKRTIDTPWTDPDGESGNIELGTHVTLDTVPMYNIDKGTWFDQKTSWFLDQVPEPRTRFCAALFENKTANASTWDLWVHGGQLLENQEEGVPDIYVLSMPSFIWTKVETTLPATNLIRSHTCHAIGGQLLIVGGYPTGVNVQTNVSCDPEYIKVLDIGKDVIAWTGAYRKDSVYQSPSTVRDIIGERMSPYYGFENTQLETDFTMCHKCSAVQPVTKHSHRTRNIIIGCVVGVGVPIVLALALIWWRRRSTRTAPTNGINMRRIFRRAQVVAVKDGNPVSETTVQIAEVKGGGVAKVGRGGVAEVESWGVAETNGTQIVEASGFEPRSAVRRPESTN